MVGEFAALKFEVELEVVPDRREIRELGAEGHCPLITNLVPVFERERGKERPRKQGETKRDANKRR